MQEQRKMDASVRRSRMAHRAYFTEPTLSKSFPQKLKWAASQEAVTLPWLSAHSIRTGIGGDTSIVDPPPRLSRINFIAPTLFQFGTIPCQNALRSLTLSSPKCYFNWF